MKKAWIVLAAAILLLAGCTAFGGEEKAADRMREKLVCALQDRSVEEVRSLFAPFAVKATNREGLLDEDIAYILEYISGDISGSSVKSCHVSDSISPEGYKKDVTATCLLDTTEGSYKLSLVLRTSAWGTYKGKGFLSLEVWSEADAKQVSATHPAKGFHFQIPKGHLGIWYPVTDSAGNLVAGTKSGREFQEP